MVYDYYTLQEFVGYITEESSAGYAVENICIKQIMPKKNKLIAYYNNNISALCTNIYHLILISFWKNIIMDT